MDDSREKLRKWVLIIVMHLLAVAAWQAWITDPDGNCFELHQYTPESKQTPALG